MIHTRCARQALGALAGLLLAALAVPQALQARELVVSQVAPFSGPQAVTGKAIRAGARLYFDEVNARGGVHGNSLRLVSRDDAQDPARTVALVGEALQQERPVALLGSVGSDNLAALIDSGVLARSGVPLVGAVSGASAVLRDRHTFVVKAGYQQEIDGFFRLMGSLGIRQVGLLYQDDALGRDVREGAAAAVARHPVTLSVAQGYARNTTEVGGAVQAMLKAAPQAIFLGATTNAAIEFVRQYRQQGGTAPLYGMSIIDTQQLLARLGPELSRGYAFAVVLPLGDDVTQPLSREYARLRAASKDPELSARSIEGYIAARLLVEALRRSPASPAPADLQRALTQGPLDLGGYVLDYSRPGLPGSTQVDFAILGAEGKVLR